MEHAVAVREAALEAVADIAPEGFRDDIEAFVADGSHVPGVLTLLAAERGGADPTELTGRAVGVQLIYDGLRLTRRLTVTDPWAGGRDDADRANVDILAADVLVSRGFFLLARTEAARDAVEVVRAFGRDQTERRDAADPAVLDRELEVDVLELALVAGTTAAGVTPVDAEEIARELAAAYDDGFPEPAALFDDATQERVAAAAGVRPLNRND